ncbi:MAG: hypothetical protein ACOC28_02640 [Alkalispirochaetaceae bacterium]
MAEVEDSFESLGELLHPHRFALPQGERTSDLPVPRPEVDGDGRFLRLRFPLLLLGRAPSPGKVNRHSWQTDPQFHARLHPAPLPILRFELPSESVTEGDNDGEPATPATDPQKRPPGQRNLPAALPRLQLPVQLGGKGAPEPSATGMKAPQQFALEGGDPRSAARPAGGLQHRRRVDR